MSQFVFTNGFVLLNAVDLSNHATRVKVDDSVDLVDKTAMGNVGHARLAGLRDWSMEFEVQQDFAGGSVDATLFAAIGITFTVEVRPTNAARSATNPARVGVGILEGVPVLDGAVGELAKVKFTVRGADGAALQRLTA
jgi:hypothetical protein